MGSKFNGSVKQQSVPTSFHVLLPLLIQWVTLLLQQLFLGGKEDSGQAVGRVAVAIFLGVLFPLGMPFPLMLCESHSPFLSLLT